VTGEERLVLYDRGDGVGAMPAAQMAELAGHPRVAVLLGGLAAWPATRRSARSSCSREDDLRAEPRRRADARGARRPARDPTLTLLDVRTTEEFTGKRGYPCDPRQGAFPARGTCTSRSSSSRRASRCAETTSARASATPRRSSRTATPGRAPRWRRCALRRPAIRARNYPGSWHEWSRHDELPLEKG
jgi:thiosulfate/3-mercaptopyruvate sulfurtransferase